MWMNFLQWFGTAIKIYNLSSIFPLPSNELNLKKKKKKQEAAVLPRDIGVDPAFSFASQSR